MALVFYKLKSQMVYCRTVTQARRCLLRLAWVPFIGDLSEAVTSGLVASRDSEEHALGMSLYRGRGRYPDGRCPDDGRCHLVAWALWVFMHINEWSHVALRHPPLSIQS